MIWPQQTSPQPLLAIPGIHFFDAHRLQPQLLQAPALQLPLCTSNVAGPEDWWDASSDEERATTDGETDVEEVLEDADLPPEEPWFPPIPDAPDDPTEIEIAGAADKLETMMRSSQPQTNVSSSQTTWCSAFIMAPSQAHHLANFYTREVCSPFHVYYSGAMVRGGIDTVEEVFKQVARNFTLRLAEKLAQYICSLTRRAESLATPETECLLYATYWFRPILSELIGAATESADVNRERAPNAQWKWQSLIDPTPDATMASNLSVVSLPYLRGSLQVGLAKLHRVLSVRRVAPFKCRRKLLLSAVTGRSKACKEMQLTKCCKQSNSRIRMPWIEPGAGWGIQAANCFSELIRGYTKWLSLTPCRSSSLLEPRG